MSCAVRSTRRRPTSGSSCSTGAARGCWSGASACCGCSTGAASASSPSSRSRRRTSSSSTSRSRRTGARSWRCTGRVTAGRRCCATTGAPARRLGHPVAMADPLGLTDFAAFTPDGRGLLTASRDPGAQAPSPDPSPDLGGREIVVRDPRTLAAAAPLPGLRPERRAVAGRAHVRGGRRRRLRALPRPADGPSSGRRWDGTRRRSTGRSSRPTAASSSPRAKTRRRSSGTSRPPRWPTPSWATPAAWRGWPWTDAARPSTPRPPTGP